MNKPKDGTGITPKHLVTRQQASDLNHDALYAKVNALIEAGQMATACTTLGNALREDFTIVKSRWFLDFCLRDASGKKLVTFIRSPEGVEWLNKRRLEHNGVET